MTGPEISSLYNKLIGNYEDGGYVSRSTLFKRALKEGIITEEVYNEAYEHYSSIWYYTGD